MVDLRNVSRKSASPVLAIATALALVVGGFPVAQDGALAPEIELVANNGGFEFDGVDDAVNLGHSAIVNLSAGEFTVHVWVQLASLTEGGPPCMGPEGQCDMSILDKMSAIAAEVNGDGWRLLKQSDDHFWFCVGGEAETNGCGAESTTVRSTTIAEPGVWYSVARGKTSSEILIYVNGLPEGAASLGAFTDTNVADLMVGANAAEGAFLNGRIRQVELFGRALSTSHIRAIYERSK